MSQSHYLPNGFNSQQAIMIDGQPMDSAVVIFKILGSWVSPLLNMPIKGKVRVILCSSMSQPSDLFVFVVRFRLFLHSNSMQILRTYHL
jgi:hypothetical protein